MSSATTITDHADIRRWVESNNERPACVKGAGKGDDPGVLRLDFDEQDESLKEISWDTWFEWFNRNELERLRSEDSRFSKLVAARIIEAQLRARGEADSTPRRSDKT